MITNEEIQALCEDPEVMADIRAGLHDGHLGKSFSGRIVFGSYDGFLLKRWFYRTCINAKKLWWVIKKPYWAITHRNCPTCIRHKGEE